MPVEIKKNRFLDKMGPKGVSKISRNIGVDELNSSFGLGEIAIAAGGDGVFAVTAARAMLLRRMFIDGAVGGITVTAITVEGNTALQGAAMPAGAWSPASKRAPDFDLPVGPGTQVSVTLHNSTAGILTCAVGFSID